LIQLPPDHEAGFLHHFIDCLPRGHQRPGIGFQVFLVAKKDLQKLLFSKTFDVHSIVLLQSAPKLASFFGKILATLPSKVG